MTPPLLGRKRATTSTRLPVGIFKEALRTNRKLQENRIRKMYNRHRALFAEAIVAALLPGAAVRENPLGAVGCHMAPPRHRIPDSDPGEVSGDISLVIPTERQSPVGSEAAENSAIRCENW